MNVISVHHRSGIEANQHQLAPPLLVTALIRIPYVPPHKLMDSILTRGVFCA